MRKPRPGKSDADRCCLFSEPPKHLDVSRCDLHRRLELWVNHVPYVLTRQQAWALGMALVDASTGGKGDTRPAEDLS
jgi:hypothetical protein